MKTKFVKYILFICLSIFVISFSACSSSKKMHTKKIHASRTAAQTKTVKDKPALSVQKKSSPPSKDYIIKSYKSKKPPLHRRR